MWLLLPAASWAVDPLPALLDLEWSRVPPAAIVPYARSEQPEVRRAVARALGRLRSAEALSALQELTADPDTRVQLAVAEALGYTPGSAPILRDWLSLTPVPRGLYGRARAEDGLRVALLEALGSAGEPADVDVLVAALSEPWPTGAAAAEALGRMALRKVEGVDRARMPLVMALGADRTRVVPMVAWALSRLGMEGAHEAELTMAARAAEESPRPEVRAWLYKGLWNGLPRFARGPMLERALADESARVRATALAEVREGDVDASLVVSALSDPDPWVRWVAIDASARVGGAALETLNALQPSTEWEEASRLTALIAAGREVDVSRVSNAKAPAVVRAALVAALDEEEWLRLALEDPEPAVRTAAAEQLLDEGVEPDVALQLLESSDVVVREVGMELLKGADRGALDELVQHLRVEPESELLALGLLVLADGVERGEKLTDTGAVREHLERASKLPSWRARHASARLASDLSIDLPERADASPITVVLPNGETLEGTSAAVHVQVTNQAVHGARVMTDRGEFRIDLDALVAPLAVSNFAALAWADEFDGLAFHRVVPGFVVQTGCPRGDGWGGPGYSLPDEVSALPFDAGAVGMARGDRDTGGSQWFVTTGDHPHLVGEYTQFGQVTQGMEVVRALQRGDRILDVLIE